LIEEDYISAMPSENGDIQILAKRNTGINQIPAQMSGSYPAADVQVRILRVNFETDKTKKEKG